MKSNLKKWHVLPFSLLLAVAACNNQNGGTTSNDTTSATSSTPSSSESNMNKGLSEKDQNFVKGVIGANMGEIKMAQLAQQKASNKEVKDLAQMLEKDHSAVLSELKSYASQHNVEAPAEEPQDAKDKYNDFTKKSGKEFDKDWCDLMEKKHKESIEKFEAIGNDADSEADLRTFANKTLPTLRSHLDHVMQCKNKLK
jgi:putative membrane protein